MQRGLIVPLVTPVDHAGEVLEADVASLIGWVRPHVRGLAPALSSGEGWALDGERWRTLLRCVVRHAEGLPVLAGVQCASTAETLRRVRQAAVLGAQGVLVAKPHGERLTQRQILLHYQRVAAATTLPIGVYHESAISGVPTELDTLLRVCALPGVCGVKDSGEDPEFTRKLVAARTGVTVWQGWEHLVGAVPGTGGAVLAMANLQPARCARAVAADGAATAELTQACEQTGVLRPDWYAVIKAQLTELAVLTSAATLGPPPAPPNRGGGNHDRAIP